VCHHCRGRPDRRHDRLDVTSIVTVTPDSAAHPEGPKASPGKTAPHQRIMSPHVRPTSGMRGRGDVACNCVARFRGSAL
jgi:hypothetical protein